LSSRRGGANLQILTWTVREENKDVREIRETKDGVAASVLLGEGKVERKEEKKWTGAIVLDQEDELWHGGSACRQTVGREREPMSEKRGENVVVCL